MRRLMHTRHVMQKPTRPPWRPGHPSPRTRPSGLASTAGAPSTCRTKFVQYAVSTPASLAIWWSATAQARKAAAGMVCVCSRTASWTSRSSCMLRPAGSMFDVCVAGSSADLLIFHALRYKSSAEHLCWGRGGTRSRLFGLWVTAKRGQRGSRRWPFCCC